MEIGILSSDLKKFFGCGYFEINGRTTEKSSGLGLYVVQNIAKLLQIYVGDEIWGRREEVRLPFCLWKRKDIMFTKCFVTGGSGYLGRHVLGRLVKQQYDAIYTLLLEGDSLRSYIPQAVNCVTGDVQKKEDVQRFLQEADSSSLVIHCAGIISVVTKPSQMLYAVNVEGTRNILDICLKKAVGKLIYVSSVHAIPDRKKGIRIAEPNFFCPNLVHGEYAKSKAMASALFVEYLKKGLRGNIVFPTGIYGPGDLGKGSFTSMLISFMKGKLPLAVKGTYDFVDVRDVAEGILLVAEKGKNGEGYILSGEYLPMRKILLTVKEILKLPKMPIFLPDFLAKWIAPLYEQISILQKKTLFFTPYSIAVLHSNCDFDRRKAERDLEYSPRGSEESMEDMVKYIKALEHAKDINFISLGNKKAYKEFLNEKEAEKWGEELYKDWAVKYKKLMDCSEKYFTSSRVYCKDVVALYCGYEYKQINEYLRGENNDDEYKQINEYLRGENNDTDTLKKDMLKKVKASILSLALFSAPRTSQDLVLYRIVGDEFITILIDKNKHNEWCKEKGFMSTSLLKNIVWSSGYYAGEKNVLKIYVPKGTVALYVSSVYDRSEYELLLPPGVGLWMISSPYEDTELNKMVYECTIYPFCLE